VNCAVEIQNALKAENLGLPPERRMEFRIGVNLGDVMVEGGQIYGDGVNVAARLESLANPGGICVSGVVHDQVKARLALNYQDLGVQQVKNIAEPVRVWRVLLDGVAPPLRKTARIRRWYWRGGAFSLMGAIIIILTLVLVQHISLRPQHTHASIQPPSKPALSLPSIPSLAVLPFANLSGDQQQEYFSDGITDDLIGDLSRVPNLFVIARTSSFTYKDKNEKAQTIGRELGVKYLLEGSTRRSGDRVRINVQLVDVARGNEVWSQRYNRQMRDIFKLQDEIVQSLVLTLGLQLTMLGKGYAVPQRTENLEAYDHYLRGLEAWVTFTPNGFAKARKMLVKAIELDPNYSDPYAALGILDADTYAWQWDTDPALLDRAAAEADKAITLDDSNAGAYVVRGWARAAQGKRDEAIDDGRQAVVLDPNSALAWRGRAEINNILQGKPEDTLLYTAKARRLNPLHSDFCSLQDGIAYYKMGHYAEAVDALKQASFNPWNHLFRVLAYSQMGREREARAEAAEVMRLSPGFSLAKVEQGHLENWHDPIHQQYLAELRKAGLK
jgi:adenylate cyclase